MTSLIKNIRLIVYDFDGVMTDNKALIFRDGSEAVYINRADGLAISELKKAGYSQVIITTETDEIVKRRAEKLDIPVYSDISDKLACLREVINEKNISKEEVIYIGNDINDLEVMNFVGFPISPNDAHQSIKMISKFVTKKSGGDGVIREVLDMMPKNKM